MNQLTIFDAYSMSGHERKTSCPDVDKTMCIETYSVKGSRRKYYRLTIKHNNKKDRYHIRGGSTIAKLANYRKQVLQGMIDRGAPVGEIIAQVTDWR